jgi:dTMP kinase
MNSKTTKSGFIVIDGVDGAGKGVQTRALLASMQKAGLDVILSREPGGSAGAEEIRSLIVEGATDKWDDMTELLLIYAARRSHLVETVWPALSIEQWVISDRFADSSRAFQGVAGELGLPVVEAMHKLVVGNFKPDLSLILDLDPEISLARAEQRGGGEDRFEKKGLAYQQRVREGFQLIAANTPESHILIDASQSVEEVSKEILKHVNDRLGLALTLVEGV